WAAIEPEAIRISGQIRDALDAHVDWVGEFARKCPVVQKLEMVTDCEEDIPRLLTGIGVQVENEAPPYVCLADDVYQFTLDEIPTKDYERLRLLRTADAGFRE